MIDRIRSFTNSTSLAEVLQKCSSRYVVGAFFGTAVIALFLNHFIRQREEEKRVDPRRFPPNLGRFFRPGQVTDRTGLVRIFLPEGKVPSLQEADIFAALFINQIGVQAISHLNEKFLVGNSGTPFSELWISPKPTEKKNYEKALGYVEENILSNPIDYFRKETEEIIKDLQFTHGLSIEGRNRPTPFRTGMMQVSDCDFTPKEFWEQHKNLFLQYGGEERELPVFRSAYKKTLDVTTFEEAWRRFTPDEQRVWKIAFFIPLPPDQLKDAMREFVNELKDKMAALFAKQVSPVEVAAWAHKQIGEIHPFGDGNGRLARILMNAILRIGRCPSVIVPNDDRYTEIIRKDRTEPRGGHLAQYLDNLPYLI